MAFQIKIGWYYSNTKEDSLYSMCRAFNSRHWPLVCLLTRPCFLFCWDPPLINVGVHTLFSGINPEDFCSCQIWTPFMKNIHLERCTCRELRYSSVHTDNIIGRTYGRCLSKYEHEYKPYFNLFDEKIYLDQEKDLWHC